MDAPYLRRPPVANRIAESESPAKSGGSATCRTWPTGGERESLDGPRYAMRGFPGLLHGERSQQRDGAGLPTQTRPQRRVLPAPTSAVRPGHAPSRAASRADRQDQTQSLLEELPHRCDQHQTARAPCPRQVPSGRTKGHAITRSPPPAGDRAVLVWAARVPGRCIKASPEATSRVPAEAPPAGLENPATPSYQAGAASATARPGRGYGLAVRAS